MEARYMMKTTVPAPPPKNTVPTMTYTVSRAVQEVKGTRSEVRMRWRGSLRMRVAEIAGTLQPNPTTSGRKALPGRPMRRIRRSVTTAARAM
jgi:hypothetical protein